MTIEEARRILGKHALGKTDEEINRIIANESELCDVLLPMFEKYLTAYKKRIRPAVNMVS